MTTAFECVAHEHCRDGEETEDRKCVHPGILAAQREAFRASGPRRLICKGEIAHNSPSINQAPADQRNQGCGPCKNQLRNSNHHALNFIEREFAAFRRS